MPSGRQDVLSCVPRLCRCPPWDKGALVMSRVRFPCRGLAPNVCGRAASISAFFQRPAFTAQGCVVGALGMQLSPEVDGEVTTSCCGRVTGKRLQGLALDPGDGRRMHTCTPSRCGCAAHAGCGMNGPGRGWAETRGVHYSSVPCTGSWAAEVEKKHCAPVPSLPCVQQDITGFAPVVAKCRMHAGGQRSSGNVLCAATLLAVHTLVTCSAVLLCLLACRLGGGGVPPGRRTHV
jgi:hypothetical protein